MEMNIVLLRKLIEHLPGSASVLFEDPYFGGSHVDVPTHHDFQIKPHKGVDALFISFPYDEEALY